MSPRTMLDLNPALAMGKPNFQPRFPTQLAATTTMTPNTMTMPSTTVAPPLVPSCIPVTLATGAVTPTTATAVGAAAAAASATLPAVPSIAVSTTASLGKDSGTTINTSTTTLEASKKAFL